MLNTYFYTLKSKIHSTLKSLNLRILVISFLCCASTSFAQDIVINEVSYRNNTDYERTEFIELYNAENTTVDISGWCLDDAVEYTFPAGTTISAGSYLIIAQDVDDFLIRHAALFADYIANNIFIPTHEWTKGKLSNSGDDVILLDATGDEVDKADYESWDEWPAVKYDDFDYLSQVSTRPCRNTFSTIKIERSIQKLHPDLPSKHGGSWTAGVPTPGSANSNLVADSKQVPVMKKVSKDPDQPNSTEDVIIVAELNNTDDVTGGINVTLEYQIVKPGNYISKYITTITAATGEIQRTPNPLYNNSWTGLAMKDDGVGPDETAGDEDFTIQLPAFLYQHRDLVRYRIRVTSPNGYNRIFPDPKHVESNYAFFVYDQAANLDPTGANLGFSNLNQLQNIKLISSTQDVFDFLEDATLGKYIPNRQGHCFRNYPGQGAVVYNEKVYDHIFYRARGKDSRHRRLKKNVKFDMNSEHTFKPFNDLAQEYDERRGKIALSGTWVSDANSHGLTESLIYKIAALTGGVNKYVDYIHFDVINNVAENASRDTGDFWGLYLLAEDWGGTLLEEHGLPDGNIYAYKEWRLSHAGEDGPEGANNAEYLTWNSLLGDSQDGCGNEIACPPPSQPAQFWNANLNFDHYYADWILNELTASGETNYNGQHSYREYYNPETQKWTVQLGDYDENFGMPHVGSRVVHNRSDSITNRYIRGALKKGFIERPDNLPIKIEMANRLRSTIDLLLNTDQLEYLLFNESKLIHDLNAGLNWTDMDYWRWNNQSDFFGYQMNYTNYFDDVVTWYKEWFEDRSNHLLNDAMSNNSLNNTVTNLVANPFYDEEVLAPNKPQILSYQGPASMPANQLIFRHSFFSDPQSDAFMAKQWRIGEWEDPNNPVYATLDEEFYEINDVWLSPEINQNSSNFLVGDVGLQAGRSYRIRVRHKNATGRWSHWSDPFEFVPTAAVNINLSIVADQPLEGMVTLSWNSFPGQKYLIESAIQHVDHPDPNQVHPPEIWLEEWPVGNGGFKEITGPANSNVATAPFYMDQRAGLPYPFLEPLEVIRRFYRVKLSP